MLLEVRGLGKRFPGVIALQDVDLDCHAGEVHALVGANGAGKSTLMNLLAGVYGPTTGEIRLDGRLVSFSSPRDAAGQGISIVYQEFSSIPQLSVAQNIFLGHELCSRFGILDRRQINDRARNLLERYNLKLDETALVETLSVAQQQLVEIAHALSVEARVLILDEPTAVLSLREQENLFDIIRNLRQSGMLILYVSHRMEEIFSIADRVTVLRDGQLIDTVETMRTSQADVVRMMIGHDLVQAEKLATPPPGAPLLSLEIPGKGGTPSRFEIGKGEILGLAGLVGAGRSRLARRLVGAAPGPGQTMRLAGKHVTIRSPRQALSEGIVYLTEDRKRDGLFTNLSVLWNTSAATFERLSTFGFVRRRAERRQALDILNRLKLVAASLTVPVSELSGGNQQKVLFGRALLCRPRLLICDEPTRGVDVGAKSEIYQLLAELAGQGVSVIFISSELKELLSTTHRIAVMHDGRVISEMATSEADEEKILIAATGMAA